MLKDLSNLRSLDISRNAISHLDKGVFGGLLQLEALNISDCASLQVIINLPFCNFRLFSVSFFGFFFRFRFGFAWRLTRYRCGCLCPVTLAVDFSAGFHAANVWFGRFSH